MISTYLVYLPHTNWRKKTLTFHGKIESDTNCANFCAKKVEKELKTVSDRFRCKNFHSWFVCCVCLTLMVSQKTHHQAVASIISILAKQKKIAFLKNCKSYFFQKCLNLNIAIISRHSFFRSTNVCTYQATFYTFHMFMCLKSSFWIISGSSYASLKLNTFPDLVSSKKVHSCHLTRKKNAIIPSRTKWMARSVYFSSWKCRGNDAVWIPNYRILCWHTSRNEA